MWVKWIDSSWHALQIYFWLRDDRMIRLAGNGRKRAVLARHLWPPFWIFATAERLTRSNRTQKTLIRSLKSAIEWCTIWLKLNGLKWRKNESFRGHRMRRNDWKVPHFWHHFTTQLVFLGRVMKCLIRDHLLEFFFFFLLELWYDSGRKGGRRWSTLHIP